MLVDIVRYVRRRFSKGKGRRAIKFRARSQTEEQFYFHFQFPLFGTITTNYGCGQHSVERALIKHFVNIIPEHIIKVL